MNITLPRETVQQAIDALEDIQNDSCNSGIWATCEFHKEALRTALEAPAAREPLTDAEIARIDVFTIGKGENRLPSIAKLVRAIEAHHGIGREQK